MAQGAYPFERASLRLIPFFPWAAAGAPAFDAPACALDADLDIIVDEIFVAGRAILRDGIVG